MKKKYQRQRVKERDKGTCMLWRRPREIQVNWIYGMVIKLVTGVCVSNYWSIIFIICDTHPYQSQWSEVFFSYRSLVIEATPTALKSRKCIRVEINVETEAFEKHSVYQNTIYQWSSSQCRSRLKQSEEESTYISVLSSNQSFTQYQCGCIVEVWHIAPISLIRPVCSCPLTWLDRFHCSNSFLIYKIAVKMFIMNFVG